MELYPDQYYEFFIYFNEGDYYTCHDLLEEMWMEEKGNLFFKGLLQMSVALYHYGYGNVKGARAMMNAAHDYLQGYRPRHWGLDLEKVIAYIDECRLLIPNGIDRVPFEQIDMLPSLPVLFLYLQD
ncbi:DUF309 domain-containing protein [Neobacillus sp. YIM B06451]|uniref:DUF309 domain-containing protein n=1 Tax=Neobacillus sp. YIM B06451 TaxID=3070994 RepID=UPI00292E32B5|nr:DUF309 domain-containing protein [Neobacillus sp. YIM B06451]